MTMNLTVFNAQTVANLSQIQMAPHIVAAMSLAVSANPKAQPPVETFKAFQVMCAHVDPDLLVVGMAECLQHCKWFPTPNEVLDACDFIQQIIEERASYRKPSSYQARGKVESKAFDIAEFKRRMLPATKAYIERQREAAKAAHMVDYAESLAHNRKMLEQAQCNLAKRGGDYWEQSVDHYRKQVAHYEARLADDDSTTAGH